MEKIVVQLGLLVGVLDDVLVEMLAGVSEFQDQGGIDGSACWEGKLIGY